MFHIILLIIRNVLVDADKEMAAKTVRHHIVRGMLCCAGIPRRNPLFDQSSRVTAGRDIVSGRYLSIYYS